MENQPRDEHLPIARPGHRAWAVRRQDADRAPEGCQPGIVRQQRVERRRMRQQMILQGEW